MKRIILIAIALNILLSSCSFSKPNTTDLFIEFHKNSITQERHTISPTNESEYKVLYLSKETSKKSPRVVLSLILKGDDNQYYTWMKSNPETRKEEIKYLANLVIEFAKDRNWDNDYYLYINIDVPGCDSCYVYDYEKDIIWIPNREEINIKMYDKFNTLSKEELKETPDGIKFITMHDIGHIKHNEVVFDLTLPYTVFIHEGKFGSYGEEGSFAK